MTPLRYPGGKQRLAPFVEEIIKANELQGIAYAEPYAGGAGVAVDLLLRRVVSEIHLNDCCPAVYAFWKSVRDEPEALCRRIYGTAVTVDEWRRQKAVLRAPRAHSRLDVGFSLFFVNRCNRSGMMTAGPIGGMDQTGNWKIDARFPKKELVRRIEAIASRARLIHLRNWDAEKFLRSHLMRLQQDVFVYLDPPYFNKADRLYANHYQAEDHERIATLVKTKLKSPWIVSYDHCGEIHSYYAGCRSLQYGLQYSAGPKRRGMEVFYFSPSVCLPRESSVKCIAAALSTG